MQYISKNDGYGYQNFSNKYKRIHQVLSILTYVGKYKPIGDVVPSVLEHLLPLCHQFATTGNCKQGKNAVRCLYTNLKHREDKLQVNN